MLGEAGRFVAKEYLQGVFGAAHHGVHPRRTAMQQLDFGGKRREPSQDGVMLGVKIAGAGALTTFQPVSDFWSQ